MARVTVVDCVFDVKDGTGPVLDLSGIPEGAEVLVCGEAFTRPAIIGPSLSESLVGRGGPVRLGPCPECGSMCAYGLVGLEPHASDECIVAQVMES